MKDSRELRAFLIQGMKDVMSGQVETHAAKAACNFAQQIYNTTLLEVKMAVAVEKLGNAKAIKAIPFK